MILKIAEQSGAYVGLAYTYIQPLWRWPMAPQGSSPSVSFQRYVVNYSIYLLNSPTRSLYCSHEKSLAYLQVRWARARAGFMFYCLRLLGHHEVWVKVEEGRQVETLSYRYDSRGCRSELPTGQVTYNELIPPLSSILVRPLESFQSFRVHPQKAVKWRFQEPPSELASTRRPPHHPRPTSPDRTFRPKSPNKQARRLVIQPRVTMLIGVLALVSTLFIIRGSTSNVPSIYDFTKRQTSGNATCDTDQSKPPGDLTACGNSTLFFIWRPKARFIAPEGWMNDPQGLYQRDDGSFHAGYQCHPQHYQWGNISQCSAFSDDLTYWRDANGWQDPKTLYPSQIYDIRGVFDGSIIKKGWQGYPTTIYTSVFPAPLGATSNPAEQQGAETQSIAYTKDGGASWIKLNFGLGNNPVIWEWPVQNMSGFRDPYAFESPVLAKMLKGVTNATGDYFLTISGGVRLEADSSAGPRLYLYRQTRPNEVRHWTYLGPLVSPSANVAFSEWSGNWGTNFETAGVTRLNEKGEAYDDGSDGRALDIVAMGTEQGRGGSHENHWPLWAAATYHNDGSGVSTTLDAVGVVDWGRVYASIFFPVSGKRSVLVGWTYEDDEDLVLAAQRGYQGAFTLFRDLFLKVTRNVDPNTPGLRDPGSWKVWNETDGSLSVVTVGQKIIPETLKEYKAKSKVSNPQARSLNGSTGYVPFRVQPTSRYYAISANLRFDGDNPPKAGFRVLASDQEYTDIYYDLSAETLYIQRDHSSLIKTYGNETEAGKLRLWKTKKGNDYVRQSLNLTIVVDNSVVEVYANDVTVITTRVYPWLSASKGAGFFTNGGGSNSSVYFSNLEVWDGLINAWPRRPADTRKPLLWDGPLPNSAWSSWSGV